MTELRYKILITKNNLKDTLQIIDYLLGSPLGFQSEYPGLTFHDINFDGYKDIQMFHYVPSNRGYPVYYKIFLYEQKNHIFTYDKEFTEKVGCDFLIDQNHKTIRSLFYDSDYLEVEYKVINGNLILLDKESQK